MGKVSLKNQIVGGTEPQVPRGCNITLLRKNSLSWYRFLFLLLRWREIVTCQKILIFLTQLRHAYALKSEHFGSDQA